MVSKTRMADCHPDRPHQAHGLCTVCHAERWAKLNPERKKAHLAKYQRTLVTDPERRAHNLARKRRYTLNLKQRVVDLLGGKCAMCGLADVRVLQIDHIDGWDKISNRDNRLRADIVAGRVDLKMFQALCANCHMLKTNYEGEPSWH